jgi:hypothetical protein
MSSFGVSACIRFMVGWLHLHLNKQTVESEPRRQTQEREREKTFGGINKPETTTSVKDSCKLLLLVQRHHHSTDMENLAD